MRKTGPVDGIMVSMKICLQHARTIVKLKFCYTLCKTQNFLSLTFPHILNKICLEALDKARR